MGGCISTEAVDNAVLVAQMKPISIINQKFVNDRPISLRITEKFSWSGDDFTIKDHHSNAIYFKIDGSAFSMREKKKLRDFNGNVIAVMEEPVFSFSHRQEIFTPDMAPWFEIKPQITMFDNILDCHVRDCVTGQMHSFTILGDWLVHKSVILCDGVPIAKIYRSYNSWTDQYIVDIAPGVDMAMMVLLCIALDEAGSDD